MSILRILRTKKLVDIDKRFGNVRITSIKYSKPIENSDKWESCITHKTFKKDNTYTEFDRPLPQKGERYRHFKIGKIVTVIGISRHTETEELEVVYEYEETIWSRPLEMFMSEVDKLKYPNATQKYRFEKIESEE